MSEENKETMLFLDNDGTLREYNPGNDILIHCDSEKDRKRLMKKLENFLGDDAKDTHVPGKWIPCSERLPENNKLVLGWYKDRDNPFSGYTYGIVMKTDMGWLFDYGNRYCSSVAAWVPMPEPYKEDNDERS